MSMLNTHELSRQALHSATVGGKLFLRSDKRAPSGSPRNTNVLPTLWGRQAPLSGRHQNMAGGGEKLSTFELSGQTGRTQCCH